MDAVKRLEPINLKVKHLLLNFFCRFFRRRRGLKKIQKLVDHKQSQLDIRNLIDNSLAFKDFKRSFLSHEQKLLLAHQRTRIAESSEDDTLA